jgi:hypothetical protein
MAAARAVLALLLARLSGCLPAAVGLGCWVTWGLAWVAATAAAAGEGPLPAGCAAAAPLALLVDRRAPA